MLIEMAEKGTRAGDGKPSHAVMVPTLADLGIEPMRSSRWQWLARLSETRFEGYTPRTAAGVWRAARWLIVDATSRREALVAARAAVATMLDVEPDRFDVEAD